MAICAPKYPPWRQLHALCCQTFRAPDTCLGPGAARSRLETRASDGEGARSLQPQLWRRNKHGRRSVMRGPEAAAAGRKRLGGQSTSRQCAGRENKILSQEQRGRVRARQGGAGEAAPGRGAAPPLPPPRAAAASAAASTVNEAQPSPGWPPSPPFSNKPRTALWALVAMMRPHNLVPSAALVLLGAWLAGGQHWAVLCRPKVWLTAGLTGGITLASMLANDVFDFYSGTDSANSPSKPLVSGLVRIQDAELAAGCLYSAVVLGCCLLEPMPLRLLVGAAAVTTYVYTPFLKRLTLVKNAAVAAVIAAAVLAGALSTQQAGEKLPVQWRATLAAFLLFPGFMYREMVMDVGDFQGDAAAGVNTLAVRFGPRNALLAALATLVSAHVLLVFMLPSLFVGVISTLCLLPLYHMTASLLTLPYPPHTLPTPSSSSSSPSTVSPSTLSHKDRISEIVSSSVLAFGILSLLICVG